MCGLLKIPLKVEGGYGFIRRPCCGTSAPTQRPDGNAPMLCMASELESKLLTGGYIGDYIGESYRGLLGGILGVWLRVRQVPGLAPFVFQKHTVTRASMPKS